MRFRRSIPIVAVFFLLVIMATIPAILADAPDVEELTWLEASPDELPGVRICGLMVYDIESDIVLQYGGFDGTTGTGDIWAYDVETDTWENMTPANSPPGRFGQGFVYDESRDKVLMFFGVNGHTYYNDMWEYDYNTNTWTEITPTVSPSPRCKGGSAYDIESDQVIFFGGYGSDEINVAETWTYNYDENTWVNKTGDSNPPARKRNPLMYDEANDITIMFGGWLGGSDVIGDTWAYDFESNTWENMNPSVAPTPRARYGRVYLPEDEVVMVTHGYIGEDGDINDTWVYDYAENTWTEIDITGEAMQKRHCFQMALDTESGIIVAQGGSGTVAYDDTWLLNPYEDIEEETEPSYTAVIILVFLILMIVIALIFVLRSRRDE